jgi:metallophosphoesterase (TIGR00282 family)
MNILFIGDIVGRTGRNAVKTLLSDLRKKYQVDFVIANGENLAGGRGITEDKYNEMMEAGVDYFTSGDHIFDQKNIIPQLDKLKILRPLNLPEAAPGKGWIEVKAGKEDLVLINLQGQVFISESVDNPFQAIAKILPKIKKNNIIIDFHGEATSEKRALGYYLDGRIAAVLGTHTHIQTNDAQILPKGTGYITDVGMVGAKESILGAEPGPIVEHFLTGLPWRYEVAKGEGVFEGVMLEIKKGKCSKIEVIKEEM